MNSPTDLLAKRHQRIRVVATLVSVAALLLLVRSLPLDTLRTRIEGLLADLGPWGPIAFAGIYIIATVAMLPGSMFTLLGSAIFGFWTAYIAVTVGSVVGAALAFLIARYAARRQVEEIAKTNSKFAAIDEAISDGGWKIVALLRLSPAVPFNVQNYLYGLTKIRFWPYVLTSWLAMIPGTLMYVHIGHAAGQAVSSREKTPLEWGLFGIGLLATIVVTVYVTKIARKKLADQTTLQLDDEAPRRTTSFPTIPVATATVLVALVLLVTLRG